MRRCAHHAVEARALPPQRVPRATFRQVALSQANGCPATLADFGAKGPAPPQSLAEQWFRSPMSVDPKLSVKELMMPRAAPPVVMSASARQSTAASQHGLATNKMRNQIGEGIF